MENFQDISAQILNIIYLSPKPNNNIQTILIRKSKNIIQFYMIITALMILITTCVIGLFVNLEYLFLIAILLVIIGIYFMTHIIYKYE